jgi:hypothetical protein
MTFNYAFDRDPAIDLRQDIEYMKGLKPKFTLPAYSGLPVESEVGFFRSDIIGVPYVGRNYRDEAGEPKTYTWSLVQP